MLASRLYYLDDLTQAEIAARLGVSRASVSRLLSEARRQGIVKIEISSPTLADTAELARATAQSLGLTAVHLTEPADNGLVAAANIGPALSDALTAANLGPGDVLLTASGRMVYESSRAPLPRLPGIVIAPMLGGRDEPDAWYQPNEIARNFCERTGGRPAFLYAPALPGPDLYPMLRSEPSICRVLDLWATASCAVIGVGAPPLSRSSLPSFVPADAVSLREAVGDVVSRFYDGRGREVAFPGSERLLSTPLATLREIPVVIAVGAGREKVNSILVGARAGYFDRLVTDVETAELLLSAAAGAPDPTAPDPTAPDPTAPDPTAHGPIAPGHDGERRSTNRSRTPS
ncbi:sugar-binding transcriptional regulator [Plantactinospora sp. KBS50]|uniref:sugar-binding transcriptional regulator n=1 Tax=Plantactinospora sp. KBS50 TaxID=2024580 RepID=UPI001E4D65A7|nr:sugar-binding domain-containing protein [Plantactinospora sp. KBS50]